jgi:hypothetical protein
MPRLLLSQGEVTWELQDKVRELERLRMDDKDLLQKLIESLHGLDRWELQRLAAEAFLLSDGPNSELLEEQPNDTVTVDRIRVHGRLGFLVTLEDDVP